MSFRLLSILLVSSIVISCGGNRVRKKPPVPSSPDELLTGCYYIVEDNTAIKKSLLWKGEPETYYIDPKAIVTVADFEEAKVNEQDGRYSLSVKLNDKGKKAFAAASKNYKGKRLAFVIANELVMAPQVYDEIPGGNFDISGNFEEKELNRFFKVIDFEMYE